MMTQSKVCVCEGLPQLATKLLVPPPLLHPCDFPLAILQTFHHQLLCPPPPRLSFPQSGQAEGVCPYMAWLHVW